ncbi:MAG: DNA-binding domain-containing protein [Pseudomonadota bacterium]
MSVSQTEFITALLDAGHPVAPGLVNPDGSPATKRFDVYRNNVAVSLTDALETAFPVIRKLIGEDNFKALAGLYLRQHPPSSPVLMFYGGEMPQFLAAFEPLKHLPYLADIARLELALRESYHAADPKPFDPGILQTLSEEALLAAVIHVAPPVRLIRSRYPIYGIWQMNMIEGAPKASGEGENVMITRPAFDPVLTKLVPGGGAFLDRLMQGIPFGKALEATRAILPEFNLSEVLVQLLEAAAIESIEGDRS